MRAGFLLGSAFAIGLGIACGDQGDAAAPYSRNLAEPGPETHLDAGAPSDSGDAGLVEVTSGKQLVKGAAMVAGVTSDGFVVFLELDEQKHQTAKVVAIDGSEKEGTKIAASTDTGKDDLRYAIDGKVVFVWSDRDARESTLTIWSKATGPIVVGPHVRPGRAAATSDGTSVAYVRDVTDAGAKVVVGPADGGTTTTLGVLDTNDACWRGVDLATAGDRLVARYCPVPASTFLLKTFDPATKATTDLGTDVSSAAYGARRLVWSESSGALKAADADGTSEVTLAGANAAEYALAGDRSIVVYRTTAGALASTLPDGGSAKTLLAEGGAIALGAVSRTGRALLFATQKSDAGTDVKSLRLDDGGVATIASKPTSCANCLDDAFDESEARALVIDPIDENGAGPVTIADLATGKALGKVNAKIVTAEHYGDAGAQRFVFIDSTGSTYGITTRGLEKKDDTAVIAKGAENVVIEGARNRAVFSFPASSPNAGVWVAPLTP